VHTLTHRRTHFRSSFSRSRAANPNFTTPPVQLGVMCFAGTLYQSMRGRLICYGHARRCLPLLHRPSLQRFHKMKSTIRKDKGKAKRDKLEPLINVRNTSGHRIAVVCSRPLYERKRARIACR
jgi:hypothetical protein